MGYFVALSSNMHKVNTSEASGLAISFHEGDGHI